MLTISFLDALPDAAAMRTSVRKKDIAIFLGVQALDFDRLALAKFDGAARIQKFLGGNQAFKFSANVLKLEASC